jgi:hypothetical protein
VLDLVNVEPDGGRGRQGGSPKMRDGAPGGNGDVACAEAAIEAIKEQLK